VKIATQQVEIKQEGDLLQVATVTRGLSEEEGGYHWVGLGYDDRIMTGWASTGQTPEQAEDTMVSLLETEGAARTDAPAL
jgi:hypothetical protein